MDDYRLPDAHKEVIARHNPVNQLSPSPVPKRKRDDGTSPSVKRSRYNQRELSVYSSTSQSNVAGNENDERGHATSTENGYVQQRHELGATLI